MIIMKNPWNNLQKQSPFMLDIDKQWVDEYEANLQKIAQKKKDNQVSTLLLHNHRLRTDDIPFPYYGNPETAKIVVLQANPGYDVRRLERPYANEILDLDFQNLLHTPNPPLYSMLPKYREWKYKDGKQNVCWYWKRTRQIREIVGWEKVASGIIYFELFPYRSVRLMYPKQLPPSQEYTFHLLRTLLKRNIWVVMTRMDGHWFENVPELKIYPRIARVKNRRSVYLSSNNLGEANFTSIVQSL